MNLRIVVSRLTVVRFGFILACLKSVLCEGGTSEPLDYKLTFFVESGKEECFHQEFKKSQSIELEYQVLEGGQGELDINFRFISPSSKILVSDDKAEENSHTLTINEDGIHQLCWDNSMSIFNARKTVFFEVYQENWSGVNSDLTPHEEFDLKAIDTTDQIHSHLLKIRHIQELFRASEARDRNLAERNYSRINYWSMFQVLCMVFVGVCQVILVKGFLDEKSKVNTLWKTAMKFK